MLTENVQHLARCRQIQLEYQKELDGLEVAIEEKFGKALERINSLLATAKADVVGAEERVRRAALAAYDVDGNKRPHPAVTVKSYSTVAYDSTAALDYARQHLPQVIKLDARAFERAAKALGLEFVKLGVEARPTIARDLSEYIAD